MMRNRKRVATKPAPTKKKIIKPVTQRLLLMREKLREDQAMPTDEGTAFAGSLLRRAYRLKDDVDEWQTFCEHDDWKHQQRDTPKPGAKWQTDALRYAMRFVIGFDADANGALLKPMKTLLNAAWKESVSHADFPDYVKMKAEEKKKKQAEARDRHAAKKPRPVSLMPNELSQELLSKEGTTETKVILRVESQSAERKKPQLTLLAIPEPESVATFADAIPKDALTNSFLEYTPRSAPKKVQHKQSGTAQFTIKKQPPARSLPENKPR